ncbi:MAG: hypothetical protein K2Y22_06450 [Candidatus Obscuribacterales bacterium]|nr:hypothetical protein [Candidatus Obscuribacterales bacterium]
MTQLPVSLPACGHGTESSVFLFLACEVGPRHHAECRRSIEELEKLFQATGTSIRLETWISTIQKVEEGKLSDVLPPTYKLSLGCAKNYQRLAEKPGQLLTATDLLAFISNTLKGGDK